MTDSVSGLILAGGQGQRLGGRDKGLVSLKRQPMIAPVIARFAPQVNDSLAISANRNITRYEQFGYPVLRDFAENFDGPLAGIQAGLHWCPTDYLAVVPCDSPLLPLDLVSRLLTAIRRNQSNVAMATLAGKRQPVFALIEASLTGSLDKFLAEGERKIGKWYESERLACVEFEQDLAFSNVNTENELAELQAYLT